MKPSASPPYDAAPAAWVAARARPKAVAASAEALPGSTQRRIRQLVVDGQHLGDRDPAVGGLGQPAQPVRPRRRRSRPARWARVFMIAVVPSESRSLVADADVAAGDRGRRDHGRAEQLLGVPGHEGWRVTSAGSRGRQLLEGGRRGRRRSVRPSPAPPRSLRPHRSTGPARRHRVRRGRSRGTAGPVSVTTVRRPASLSVVAGCRVHRQHQVVAVEPTTASNWLGAVPGRVVPGLARRVAAARSSIGCRRASRRCRSWSRSTRPAEPGVVDPLGSSTTSAIGERQMLPRQTSAIAVAPGRREVRGAGVTRSPITLVDDPGDDRDDDRAADRRPEAVDVEAESSLPASQLVSISMHALITSRNSPSVRTMNGIEQDRERSASRTAVTTPRISATTSSGTSLSSISSCPWVGPVKQMPSKSQAATASAMALVTSQVRNRMKPTAGAY